MPSAGVRGGMRSKVQMMLVNDGDGAGTVVWAMGLGDFTLARVCVHTNAHNMHICVCIKHTQLESRVDTCCFCPSSHHLPFTDNKTLLFWELSLFQPKLSVTGHMTQWARGPHLHWTMGGLQRRPCDWLIQSELFRDCPVFAICDRGPICVSKTLSPSWCNDENLLPVLLGSRGDELTQFNKGPGKWWMSTYY